MERNERRESLQQQQKAIKLLVPGFSILLCLLNDRNVQLLHSYVRIHAAALVFMFVVCLFPKMAKYGLQGESRSKISAMNGRFCRGSCFFFD